MPNIPISEFAPDQPDAPSSTSDTVLNVVPLTAISYGPQPSLQSYSSALTARCQGGISIADSSGNSRIFAGDATKLYRLTSASTTFSNVSKAGTYSTPTTDNWGFELFGNRVIATNFTDAPQSYVDGTSALFSDMITSGMTTLKAKRVAVVKDFVVFGNTTDGTYGLQPQRVWWSAINDPTNFPVPGTAGAANVLSDYQDIVGNHGQLQGIAGNLGTASAAIFFERSVYRMIYVGMPDVFAFQVAEGARGLLSPGALVKFGSVAYYIGEDGFYAFDGSNSRPIGKTKVDRYFFNDLRSDYSDRITSSVDPSRGLIYWAYPGVGSGGGLCNRIIIYSPVLDRFTITDYGSVNVEALLRGVTFGKTLEQLDAISSSIDTLPFSLDSQVWAGGRSVLSGFDSAHKLGYFDGTSLAATIDTTDIEFIDGRQSIVNRVRPLADTASATVAVYGRDTISTAVSYGAAGSQEADGTVAVPRVRGRFHRVRTAIPAGTNWIQFSGVNVIDVKDVGGQR
jgi:hypothetical protein